MCARKLSKEEVKELEEIRFATNKPKDEGWRICPLIENIIRSKDSKVVRSKAPRQYKISIPKRIADGAGLTKKTHQVRMKLDKSLKGEPMIIIEVIKK